MLLDRMFIKGVLACNRKKPVIGLLPFACRGRCKNPQSSGLKIPTP